MDAETNREVVPATDTPVDLMLQQREQLERLPATLTAALEGEVEMPSPLVDLQGRLREEWQKANDELTFRTAQLQELAEGKRLMAQRHRRQLAELKEQQAREIEQHQDLVDNETKLHRRLQQALLVIDTALGSINAFTMETPAKVLADASPKRSRQPRPEGGKRRSRAGRREAREPASARGEEAA